MPAYSLHLLLQRVTVTEPLHGIATATYRVSLDYVPASQIYGLILKSFVLKRLNPRKTTLDILEDILEEKDSVIEVSPAYPYSEDIQEMVLAEDLDVLSPIRAIDDPSVLWGLVEVPKPVKRLLDRRGIKCERLPLALLAVIGPIVSDERLAQWISSICRSTALRLGKRFRVGIAFDRVRKAALHGYFYAYQYTFTEHPHYIASISTRKSLEGLEPLLKALGIGYKKSINNSISDLILSRTRATKLVRKTMKEVIHASLNMAPTQGHGDKFRVLVYAHDNSIFPLKGLKGRIVELWINKRNRVYLEITNRFYLVNIDSYILAAKGSYMILEYKNIEDVADDIKVIYEKFPENPIGVEGVADHMLPCVFDWEKSLILDKIFKSFQNLVLIPYPEVENR